jgi:hypothetical protein
MKRPTLNASVKIQSLSKRYRTALGVSNRVDTMLFKPVGQSRYVASLAGYRIQPSLPESQLALS